MNITAHRIKEALDLRGMKQADLVEKTGIGKSSISTYISGSYEPKQKNLYKIAKALNVSLAWLIGYDVPMDSTLTPDEAWDKEAAEFQLIMDEDLKKEQAFKTQLESMGWSYEPEDNGLQPDDNDYHCYYVFRKKKTSFIVSQSDFKLFINDSREFFAKRLRQLNIKSFDTDLLNAAHERTDIKVTDEMRQHDEDLINGDD